MKKFIVLSLVLLSFPVFAAKIVSNPWNPADEQQPTECVYTKGGINTAKPVESVTGGVRCNINIDHEPAGTHNVNVFAKNATHTSASVPFTFTVSGAPSLPDVIVTSLSYANGIFTSVVKNQGTKATPSGIQIGVGYFVNGVQKTWGNKLGPLAAGASVTIGTSTSGGPFTIPNGTHTIMAHVDDVNRFAESNETNNKLSQSITVCQ